MKNPPDGRVFPFPIFETLIALSVIAMLAAIAIPNCLRAKKIHDAEEVSLKKEIGERAEQLFVSIGKGGEETFYYLVPDSQAIISLNQPVEKPFATAPSGYKIVKVRSNKVIEKNKTVSLEAQ